MRRPLALCTLALALVVSQARAEATAEDKAAADALYEQAGTLIKAGRFAEACPKLETSQRLDPGTGTLLRLGYCLEQLGRTASAWSAFNEAEAMARKANDKRAGDAAARAKALEPKLSRLVIKPASPVAGEVVQRDGKAVDGGLWGTEVPVDPGEHTIEARAPGRRVWTSKIVVAGPGTTAVDVPVLVEGPLEAPADTSVSSYWGPRRIAGVSVAGVGVVSAVVGAVFGARAVWKSSLSDQTCHPVGASDACDAAGLAARHDAKTAATVSDVTLAVGVAGLAAGAALFFTAPAPVKTTAGGAAARIGVGPVGVAGTGIVLNFTRYDPPELSVRPPKFRVPTTFPARKTLPAPSVATAVGCSAWTGVL